MTKGMIVSLLACFFGAALTAACDPQSLGKPPIELVPTIGSGDDIAPPGACSAAASEQACRGALTCVWSGDRCTALQIAAP